MKFLQSIYPDKGAAKDGFFDLIFIVCITLEALLLLVTNICHITDQLFNSVALFVVSLASGILLIVKYYGRGELVAPPVKKQKRAYLVWVFTAVAFLLVNVVTIQIFKKWDYHHVSDIIPAIEILVKRFLSGQDPYDPHAMEVLYYKGPSNYLPMMWLPYTLAEWFRFDYRSISFAGWGLGALFLIMNALRYRGVAHAAVVVSLLAGSYLLLAIQFGAIIGGTAEIMSIGYYFFFLGSMGQRNTIAAGIAIGCCILSRYYLVLWLPLWVWVMAFGRRKELFQTMLTTAVFILVFFVVPFMSRHWDLLPTSFRSYGDLAYHEWIVPTTDFRPYHLYNGTGFAFLFYDKYRHMDLYTGYLLYKSLFMAMVAGSVLVMALVYFLIRKKIDHRIFLLASFKIYISIFLAFVILPYLYLTMSALFFSVAIYAVQKRFNRPVSRPL